MLNSRSVLFVVAVAWSVWFSAGPVAAADGKVSGAVAVGGKPLVTGKVFFHLDGGQFVGAKVTAGKFRVDRVPVGARKVTIEGERVPPRYANDDTTGLTAEILEGDNVLDFSLP